MVEKNGNGNKWQSISLAIRTLGSGGLIAVMALYLIAGGPLPWNKGRVPETSAKVIDEFRSYQQKQIEQNNVTLQLLKEIADTQNQIITNQGHIMTAQEDAGRNALRQSIILDQLFKIIDRMEARRGG